MQHNENLAKSVVSQIMGIQLPAEFRCPLTHGERAQIFYTLGMSELQLTRRGVTEEEYKEEEYELILKKVKVLSDGDRHHSFEYQVPEHEPSENLFSNQRNVNHDVMEQKDNDIILSFNQRIQSQKIEPQQLFNLAEQLLQTEIQQNMTNRYDSFLNAFTELFKLVVVMEINKQSMTSGITNGLCKLIQSLPRHTKSVFDMLQYLCEMTLKTEHFQAFFDTLKFFVKLHMFMGTDTNLSLPAILSINHQAVLDFVKEPDFLNQAPWNILEKELLEKVKLIIQGQELLYRESVINLIFFLGLKQTQSKGRGTIVGSLINQLHMANQQTQQDVYNNLMKIKSKINGPENKGFIDMLRYIAKDVANWAGVPMNIVLLFMHFQIQAQKVFTSDCKLACIFYITFIVRYSSGEGRHIMGIENIYNQVISNVFEKDTEFSQLSTFIIDGLPIATLVKLLHEQNLKQSLSIEGQPFLHVFLRFIRDGQKHLQENNLFDFFKLGLRDNMEQVKFLLDKLLTYEPQAIFMVIVLNFNRPESLYEYVAGLMNQAGTWQRENLMGGLRRYLQIYKDVRPLISSRLSDQFKVLLDKL